MGGCIPPPSAIFKHVFDEYNFSKISYLFDNNKPFAPSTHNRKYRNKMHLFGETLRIRGTKFKGNLPENCLKSIKMATTISKFSNFFRGSLPLNSLEPYLFSIRFKIILPEKMRLKICQNLVRLP